MIAAEGYPLIYESDCLGRVYTVHPNDTECYHLRLLLHTVRGPTSFEALRTFNESPLASTKDNTSSFFAYLSFPLTPQYPLDDCNFLLDYPLP